MYLIVLRYRQPIGIVEQHLQQHREYLDRHFATGDFIASGAQVPRVGGVILARARSRADLDAVLSEDPFYREGLALYEVIEFVPSKSAPGVEALLTLTS